MIDKSEKATELFAKGYNCAQSVFGAFCEELGMDTETAFRLANGFGGGFGCGEVCGAVSGAVLAIGLRCGFHIEGDFKQKGYCNEKTSEFVNKFTEMHKSIKCRELLGIDIRRRDDFNTDAAQANFKKICPGLVASAVRILEGMGFDRREG
jgi:C_GCAxxG_C_C family probable redox protein